MNINELELMSFEKAIGRGYKPEEVDTFKNDVIIYVKSLLDEKADLFEKLKMLANKVEEYKKDEESIREALLGAQKLGKTVLNEANQKAELNVKTAQEKAESIVAAAKQESEKILEEARNYAEAISTRAKNDSEKLLADTRVNVDTTLRNCKYEIEKEQNILARTQKESTRFKTELLDLYRQHIDLIKKMPESKNDLEKETKDLDKEIYEQKLKEQKTISTPVTTPTATVEQKPTTDVAQPQQKIDATQPKPVVETKTDLTKTKVAPVKDASTSQGLELIKNQETKEYRTEDIKGSFIPNPPKTSSTPDNIKVSKKFGELDFGNQNK